MAADAFRYFQPNFFGGFAYGLKRFNLNRIDPYKPRVNTLKKTHMQRIRKLHFDIETFSSEDIKLCGSYKYMTGLDFEILLLAYAFDDEPIKCVDLAQGESYPAEFLKALQNPEIEKHAHNANFERNAFKAIGYDIPIEQWRCSMVKAAYCGYLMALAKASEAMKLGEKGKLKSGTALINYFCKPCKPTKTNGQRHRNFADHNPEKWELFKQYCINDAEAEREIDKRLSKYEMPAEEWLNYALDQRINDRGVLIDIELAQSAYDIDIRRAAEIAEEVKEITGVENPNSLPQLKRWLGGAMQKEITSLAKSDIPTLIKEADSEAVRETLRLRQKLGKTSVKKYTAMLNRAEDDDRVRGVHQHYASHTGRWGGRGVQTQNIPRNYLEDLEEAREVIRSGDYERIIEVFDNIPEVLSQLIRTAIIADAGKSLVVADFSAIEARVLAWIAGETWRLKVFKTHGKIYEASAAMMFSVDIEDVTKGSEYRQKGKIAELALGYQGAEGAMSKMGAEDMGLKSKEVRSIVKLWRRKNPKIVKFWEIVETAAKRAVKTRIPVEVKGLTFDCDGKALVIKLPSGRELFYQEPTFTLNKFGSESIKYMGVESTTKKWTWIDTYGGKLTENIVQAISRDLLVYSMQNLEKAGFSIVMHVHDEAVAECFDQVADESLKRMCDIMGRAPKWAKDLPLNAEGFVSKFYKKD